MKFTVILFTLLLGGCYQSLNNADLKKAIYTCAGVENIEYIESTALGDESVRCANKSGSEFLGKIVLP